MFNELAQKPIIGMVSGVTSWVLMGLQNILIDDSWLKIVGAIGIWLGAIIAFLTCILKLIEFSEKIISYFRKS